MATTTLMATPTATPRRPPSRPNDINRHQRMSTAIMRKITPSLFALTIWLSCLNVIPATAQPARVFVAAQGLDTNPCTFAQPCRSFQKAHDTVAAGGEINALDPADYGILTINKSISVL